MTPEAQAALEGRSMTASAPAPVPESIIASTEQPISTGATDPGKADAPVIGQAPAATPEEKPNTAVPALAKSEQAEPVISDEMLLNAAGLAETPDKKLSRIEREYSASSKEARRLAEYAKRLQETLDEQGLVVVEDEGKLPKGLFATKKYNKDVGELNVKFKDLPEDHQALFESEPQKAIDMIVEKAKKALIRVVPTIDEMPVSAISPERHETALSYLADSKWETGDSRFPGITKDRQLVDKMVNAPNTSKALKDFYNKEPELAMSLLHLQLEHARSHIREQSKKSALAAEEKKKAIENQPTLAPSGGGTPNLGDPNGGTYADQLSAQMRGLRLNPY